MAPMGVSKTRALCTSQCTATLCFLGKELRRMALLVRPLLKDWEGDHKQFLDPLRVLPSKEDKCSFHTSQLPATALDNTSGPPNDSLFPARRAQDSAYCRMSASSSGRTRGNCAAIGASSASLRLLLHPRLWKKSTTVANALHIRGKRG